MKILPKNYALALAQSLDENQDINKIARSFWEMLVRNGQQKNLREVLSLLPAEYCKLHNKAYVEVISAEPLMPAQITEIEKDIEKRLQTSALVENIAKPSLTAGIIVRVDGKEMDLSVKGKIDNLKKQLSSGNVQS